MSNFSYNTNLTKIIQNPKRFLKNFEKSTWRAINYLIAIVLGFASSEIGISMDSRPFFIVALIPFRLYFGEIFQPKLKARLAIHLWIYS